jgi:hypothetical protein
MTDKNFFKGFSSNLAIVIGLKCSSFMSQFPKQEKLKKDQHDYFRTLSFDFDALQTKT